MMRTVKGLVHRSLRRHRPGTAPGEMYRNPEAEETRLRVIAYDRERLVEREIDRLDELDDVVDGLAVRWIDVVGLGDLELLGALGERFGLHSLALEDVTQLGQRAKVDEYEEHLFVVARMVREEDAHVSEQVGIFLGDDFVLTFQERSGDTFEPVRARIRDGRPNLRGGGPEYLAYALIDSIVDGYFPVLDRYGDRLESLEERVLEEPSPELMATIQRAKRDLLAVRRALWPHREMLNSLIRDHADTMGARTVVFVRDAYDGVVQAIDVLESYREVASGLVDLHLASAGNRMNEVMKVLTMIATIFIPLGFVAGLYGMNFDPSASPWNMPELGWYWGYPMVIGAMITIAGGMLLYFRRKGWL